MTPLISGLEVVGSEGGREGGTVINVTGCRWSHYTGRLIRIKAGAQFANSNLQPCVVCQATNSFTLT